jgi:hypothetical protein
MAARLMALDFQYLEIDGVEFDTYWQNGGYKKISDIIFAECHIFIVSNLWPSEAYWSSPRTGSKLVQLLDWIKMNSTHFK